MTFRAGIALAGRPASWIAASAAAVLGAVAVAPFARAGDDLDAARAARKAERDAGLRDYRDIAKDVDAALAAAWKEQGLNAAPRCTDEEFVRRVYLDLVGTIPSAQQVESFLADQHMEKREKLVESLIHTPGYTRHIADLWAEVLVGSGGNEKDKDFAPGVFRPWLEKQFVAKRSYSDLIHDVLTATGTPYSSPPVNFFGRSAFTATDLAGRTSQAFLGVKIQCAQCHDHPYEDIKQKDFQGMAAFFARMTLRPAELPYEMFGDRAMKAVERREDERVKELMKNNKDLTEEQARMQVRKMRPKTTEVGEITGDAMFPKRMRENPQRLEKIPAEVAKTSPKFLHSVEYQDAAGASRRAALADWIANPANPYTGRALANRYWGWFLGRGFVTPVDDFSSVNTPTVPAALDVLSKDCAESGFDFDRLVRVITSTKAYQLSSASPKRDKKAQEFFSVGPLKQFSPQQTFDSLQVALGVVEDPTQMSDVEGAAPSAIEMGGRYGQMAMGDEEKPDPKKTMVRGAGFQFFRTFDDDEGGGVTTFEGTIPQGLFMLNSQVVNGLLTNPVVSVVPKIVADKSLEGERAKIRHLFVRTLSRAPTEKEMVRFVNFVKSSPPEGGTPTSSPDAKGGKRPQPTKRMGPPEQAAVAPYADVLWALVSSSEFATNH
jgi:hypothetical protein